MEAIRGSVTSRDIAAAMASPLSTTLRATGAPFWLCNSARTPASLLIWLTVTVIAPPSVLVMKSTPADARLSSSLEMVAASVTTLALLSGVSNTPPWPSLESVKPVATGLTTLKLKLDAPLSMVSTPLSIVAEASGA